MIRPNVLPLEHVPNARDLGGYVGFDGRKIKMHRLLRTGKLCQMTKEDETFLLNYGLTKIIDLRSPKEIKITPDVIPAGIEHIDNPIHGNQSAETDQKIAQLKKTYTKDQYAGFKTMCHQYYSSKSYRNPHSSPAADTDCICCTACQRYAAGLFSAGSVFHAQADRLQYRCYRSADSHLCAG